MSPASKQLLKLTLIWLYRSPRTGVAGTFTALVRMMLEVQLPTSVTAIGLEPVSEPGVPGLGRVMSKPQFETELPKVTFVMSQVVLSAQIETRVCVGLTSSSAIW